MIDGHAIGPQSQRHRDGPWAQVGSGSTQPSPPPVSNRDTVVPRGTCAVDAEAMETFGVHGWHHSNMLRISS
jgi:hypothetical protein